MGAGTKIKVIVIVGTRPEAIKMAPVINELQARGKAFDLTVVNTAQHREMVDQVFSVFNIKPDIDLDLMEQNQSLSTILIKTVEALDKVLSSQEADILLIEGDTSTVFVAALIAFYNRIDVGHVEAGLRTSNIYNPFPEEVNRRITSVISRIHFAPTEWARGNLIREGYAEESIFVTGNTVIDSLLKAVETEHEFQHGPLSSIDYGAHKVILVTGHRRENHGEPLRNICKAILELTRAHKEVLFVYPVHPNPNVSSVVRTYLEGNERIFLVNPLDYLSFVHLMKKSYLILTDSGGIQEEAPSLGKPVLVMRKTTERPEAREAGTARIIGTDTRTIINEVNFLLTDEHRYSNMATAKNPFGDGNAAKRIVDIIFRIYSR